MARRVLVAAVVASSLAACSSSGDAPASDGPWSTGYALPEETQSPGDPVKGREALLSGDYMTCGIPFKLYQAFPGLISSGLDLSDKETIPGRDGPSADLPHSLNRFTAPDGADVVNANCLTCHSGHFDGKLVLGLGNATADFTATLGGGLDVSSIPQSLLDSMNLTQAEKDELALVSDHVGAVAPYATMRTIGMNPAEMFAVVLMVHHDRSTLAWSDAELQPPKVVDADGKEIQNPRVTSDPPPWWRAHKKHALFCNGMARGDHRGTMALATSVCVDSIDRAKQVDDEFRDIEAFVESVRPPAWTRKVDAALASRGKDVFSATCAGCHGTYAADQADDAHDTYPNLLIPLPTIGTDPVVANAGVVHAPQLVDWYDGSFYGGITRMTPNDPFPGYMPPPLDGVWATAPYLHNGSVPSIELVLDSTARPARWKRVDYDDTHYDEDALGWPWQAVDTPWDQLPAADQKNVYDTTFWSQGNGGHTFGDALSKDDRRAVIEYLKTL